jgi:biopolymer transport protein ExbB
VKTARNKMKEATSLLMSLMLVAGLSGNAMAAPATPAGQAVTSAATQPAAADAPAPANSDATPAPVMQPAPTEATPVIPTDLSVMGMYHHADAVVKTVMIGLLLASVVTWALLFSKGAEVFTGKRRMRREFDALSSVRTLDEAAEQAESFAASSISAQMIRDAQNELELSAGSTDNNGIKERTGFRLERRVSAAGRYMGRGNGILATIGAISPFVGLFGTVWGIMSSFQSIAASKNTSLAVVAPGIAEALFATAIGLIAAIPATIFYNKFTSEVNRQAQRLEGFADEFSAILSRQIDERA